ncbi:Zn-dependent hydrolase [Alteracholeplasma palmae J233]|uniref:Zn-dependent hydrolase n=1 Tax=Alteracholeplasma palmae (strain ATCC 49389 / J233) TaxID=1318466 RepID=U4KPH8_ALTPJ|nr:MBL fold metallo-hydrolase [Alteracholeplasma palmae]CCV64150.1 Zn-dependent hydrolase [Alteracholeplasma palmae J233]
MEIKQIKLGSIRSNCYVVSHLGKAMIIDPGFEDTQVIDYLTQENLEPTLIYVTHGHFDHCGGVKQLKELYHIPVYAPLKDKIWMTDNAYNRWLYDIPVDFWITGKDSISFSGLEFKILETPGHSEGGTMLYLAPYLFGGDTLFFESIGRTDIPFSSLDVLLDTIRNLYKILPDNTTIYPGHGRPTTISHEKQNNPFVRGV